MKRRHLVGSAAALAGSALLSLAAATPASGAPSLVLNSPFAPNAPLASGPGSKAPPGDYELSGSSSSGGEVTVCIFERASKKSQWIPVGGELDGIHVVSYDPARDSAVVTISGSRHELEMKRSVVGSLPAAGGGVPRNAVASMPRQDEPPVDGAPPSPEPASVTGREQQEARMMVSDLLEIGVQQRKAYQAARMKTLPASAVPKRTGN